MINNLTATIPFVINFKGKLLSLKKPVVMGVLNITDDSFFEKSRFTNIKDIIEQTQKMLHVGATIIDIGAASSKPGAKLISSVKEIELLRPVLKALVETFPETYFSIDTYNAETAKFVVENGASMINDISAGKIDHDMFETVASLDVPYVMMHMQGLPETMQENPKYEDVLQQTIEYFTERVEVARNFGIKDIILDPGFGFGKNLEHNYCLLKHLKLLEVFQLPILCGLSRKSMINNVIHTNPNQALNGTTVLNTIALLNGAHILRVHDVLEAQQAIDLVNFYNNA
jgi:dihydropteroate synthase